MYDYLKEEKNTVEESFRRLVDIVAILRKECPWDREQDHKSLRPCLIEEAYEAAEAIDNEDKENLREELGDVMLQVLFHSLFGEEDGVFTLVDVINEECEKMIRRHPHVFADGDANSVDTVLEKWDNIKDKEHKQESESEKILKVPKALPALIRSSKIQKKIAKAGGESKTVSLSLEEVARSSENLATNYQEMSPETRAAVIGDILYEVVNAARLMEVEPENALERSVERSIGEFVALEEHKN